MHRRGCRYASGRLALRLGYVRRSPLIVSALASTLVFTGCGTNETPKPGPPPVSPVTGTTRDAGPMSIADANLYVVPVSGTSLHRTLVFLNDKTAPLQIAEAKSLFQGKRGAEPTTSTLVDHQIDMQVKASQPVAAVRARIVYFD